jgi:hypothetical protein
MERAEKLKIELVHKNSKFVRMASSTDSAVGIRHLRSPTAFYFRDTLIFTKRKKETMERERERERTTRRLKNRTNK